MAKTVGAAVGWTEPKAPQRLAASIRGWSDEMSAVMASLDHDAIAKAIEALAAVRRSGGTIFTCGNGGSAGTASHLALDLQKAARGPSGGTRALCISDSMGLITAWANDADFDRVFAEQLAVLGRRGDALLVISVSGSSPNLIVALETAKTLGIVTVGFLGKDGGAARGRCDWPIVVRSEDYGWVESAHVVLHHMVTNALRDDARNGA